MSDKMGDKMSDKMGDKMSDKMGDKMSDKEHQAFAKIQEYLAVHSYITSSQAQTLLGKSASTVRRYFVAWVAQGLLESAGENKQRIYYLAQKSVEK